jgi:cytochrome d ubiquinol oxidase subunit II
MIHTLWFLVLAVMLAGYAVLDGFDLGVGIVHFVVGRTAAERATVIGAIGPVWNGNEVWLIAAGGAMVVAFPTLYAASFSGFYLALMLVLWLLILRGLAIEFRHQLDHPLWREAWDVVFSVSSLLLALLFGVAMGNVLRGVPLDADGHFQGSFALMLNPFAVVGGALGIATLAMHGAAWLALKTEGAVHERARRTLRTLWFATTVALLAMLAASFIARPDFTANFTAMPALLLVPAAGLACLAVLRRSAGRRDGRAFAASAGLIAAIVGSAAAGLYPRLLPTTYGSTVPSLDIYNAASPDRSLWIAFVIYVAGMAIVVAYLWRIYGIWRGRTSSYD